MKETVRLDKEGRMRCAEGCGHEKPDYGDSADRERDVHGSRGSAEDAAAAGKRCGGAGE